MFRQFYHRLDNQTNCTGSQIYNSMSVLHWALCQKYSLIVGQYILASRYVWLVNYDVEAIIKQCLIKWHRYPHHTTYIPVQRYVFYVTPWKYKMWNMLLHVLKHRFAPHLTFPRSMKYHFQELYPQFVDILCLQLVLKTSL